MKVTQPVVNSQDENPCWNPQAVVLTTKWLPYNWWKKKGPERNMICPHSHSKSREMLGPTSNLSVETEGLVTPFVNCHWASCYGKPRARHQAPRSKDDSERTGPWPHIRDYLFSLTLILVINVCSLLYPIFPHTSLLLSWPSLSGDISISPAEAWAPSWQGVGLSQPDTQ